MALRDTMEEWVIEALRASGGHAPILQVAQHVWDTKEKKIRQHPNALYEWQYEMRWAADQLRKKKVIGFERKGGLHERSVWKILTPVQPPHDDDVPF